MKAVVLCAGFGTRLGEWTRETPKPMLELAGKPILGHILEYLSSRGIRQVAVNLHFHPDRIPAYFKNGAEWGVDLHYSHEEKLLGTAGALGKLSPWLADTSDVLVLYGDILTDQDLDPVLEAHRKNEALATLLLHQRKKSNSVVKMDENRRITSFLERPSEAEWAEAVPEGELCWVNSGVQVVSTRILKYIAEGAVLDLPRDIYARNYRETRIFGFPLSGKRIAVDSQERFLEAQDLIVGGNLKIRKGN